MLKLCGEELINVAAQRMRLGAEQGIVAVVWKQTFDISLLTDHKTDLAANQVLAYISVLYAC